MRDVYALLLQKESDLQRLRHEVEALRTIIPLLEEEGKDSPELRLQNRWPLEVQPSG